MITIRTTVELPPGLTRDGESRLAYDFAVSEIQADDLRLPRTPPDFMSPTEMFEYQRRTELRRRWVDAMAAQFAHAFADAIDKGLYRGAPYSAADPR